MSPVDPRSRQHSIRRLLAATVSAAAILAVALSLPSTPRSYMPGGGTPRDAFAAAAASQDEARQLQAGSLVPGETLPALGLSRHVQPSCSGGDGYRVQALYIVDEGETTQLADRRDEILQDLATADDIVAVSSERTGGGRRVRWVHDANCVPSIETVYAPPAGDLAFWDHLSDLGYDRPDRRYLMFFQRAIGRGCSGTLDLDDSADPTTNEINAAPAYAFLEEGCLGGAVTAHEIVHTLGGVQRSAPNSTAYGHCTDDNDLMCYADGEGTRVRLDCPDQDDDFLLDCNHDDYFNTDPAAGTYLATHWNVARSPFLDTVAPLTHPQVTITASADRVASMTPVTFAAVSSDPDTDYAWEVPSPDQCSAIGPVDRAVLTITCNGFADGRQIARVHAVGSSGYGVVVDGQVTIEGGGRPTGVVTTSPAHPVPGDPITLNVTNITGQAPVAVNWRAQDPACTISTAGQPVATMVCGAAAGTPVEVCAELTAADELWGGSCEAVNLVKSPAATSTNANITVTTTQVTSRGNVRPSIGWGDVVDAGAVQLQFQRWGTKTWISQGVPASVGGDGTFAMSWPNREPGTYRVRYTGTAAWAASTSWDSTFAEVPATSTWRSVTSKRVTILVADPRGTGLSRMLVELSHRVRGRWVPIDSGSTNSRGLVTMVRPSGALRARSLGSYGYLESRTSVLR